MPTSDGGPASPPASAPDKAVLDALKEELKGGRHAEVREKARALLADYPSQVVLLSIAASACYSLKLYEEARTYLERALEIQPDSRVLAESLAKVQARLDD